MVNTSSINAIWTWPEHAAYSAAKAAVQGLSESLMIECMVKAPHVQITCAHPGGVRTQIAANRLVPGKEDDSKIAQRESRIQKMFDKIVDLSAGMSYITQQPTQPVSLQSRALH